VAGWIKRSRAGLELFELEAGPGLLVAVLSRVGGASAPPFDLLNLSHHVGDDPSRVDSNRKLARAALDLDRLATVRQVHGTAIHNADPDANDRDPVKADALVTARPGTGLGIKVADCLPVFVWDRDMTRVGIAHCGWKGTVAGLAVVLARDLAARAGIAPDRLRFALGPCICPACYPVGDDVVEQVSRALPSHDRLLAKLPDGGTGFDIREANRLQLRDAGLEEAGSLDRCTFEEPRLFYSARRDRTTGRNLAVIALPRRG
jgi:YfiH family protein